MCNRVSDDSLSLPIVDRKYVFNRRITLKDLSANADDTGMQRGISIHLKTFKYRMGSALSLSLFLFKSWEYERTPKYAPVRPLLFKKECLSYKTGLF